MEDVLNKPAPAVTGSLGSQFANDNDDVDIEDAAPAEPVKPVEVPPVAPVKPAEPAKPAEPVVITPEENVVKFGVPRPAENAPAEPGEPAKPAAPAKATSLEDVLKTYKREDIAKIMGFDDFDLQMSEHRKNGGDAAKFIQSKVDYSKVPDLQLIKEKIKAENSFMDAEELNVLTEMEMKKYGLNDDASEIEKKYGAIQLKRDGHAERQLRIAEQQKFQTPPAKAVENTNAGPSAQEVYVKTFMESPTTINLLQTKRVVAQWGDTGSKINFDVEDPQEVVGFWTDPNVSAKYLINERGEPDLETQNLMALLAMNKTAFLNTFIDLGRQQSERERLATKQNISKKGEVVPPSTNKSWNEAVNSATSGKLGDM